VIGNQRHISSFNALISDVNSQEITNLRHRLLAISASLAVGLGLMAIKFIAFYLTNSAAILSDALESIINVVAAGFRVSSTPRPFPSWKRACSSS